MLPRPVQTAVRSILTILLPLLALAGLPALAAAPDCALEPHSPSCALDHTLRLLYWIAGGLAFLLLLVAALAIAIYRKNKSVELMRRDR